MQKQIHSKLKDIVLLGWLLPLLEWITLLFKSTGSKGVNGATALITWLLPSCASSALESTPNLIDPEGCTSSNHAEDSRTSLCFVVVSVLVYSSIPFKSKSGTAAHAATTYLWLFSTCSFLKTTLVALLLKEVPQVAILKRHQKPHAWSNQNSHKIQF